MYFSTFRSEQIPTSLSRICLGFRLMVNPKHANNKILFLVVNMARQKSATVIQAPLWAADECTASATCCDTTPSTKVARRAGSGRRHPLKLSIVPSLLASSNMAIFNATAICGVPTSAKALPPKPSRTSSGSARPCRNSRMEPSVMSIQMVPLVPVITWTASIGSPGQQPLRTMLQHGGTEDRLSPPLLAPSRSWTETADSVCVNHKQSNVTEISSSKLWCLLQLGDEASVATNQTRDREDNYNKNYGIVRNTRGDGAMTFFFTNLTMAEMRIVVKAKR